MQIKQPLEPASKSPDKKMKADRKLMRRASLFQGLETLLMKQEKLETMTQLKLLLQTDFKTFPNFQKGTYKYRSLYEMIEQHRITQKSNIGVGQKTLGYIRS